MIFFDVFMTQVLSSGTHSGARRQCFIILMCFIWKEVQIESLGSMIHPVVDSWEFSVIQDTRQDTNRLMDMTSRDQKWNFSWPTRFLTKSLDFDTDFDLNECFQSNGTAFWSFGRLIKQQKYFSIPINRLKKKSLPSKNSMKINMDVFWSTTINFRPIRWHEGLIYVSGTPFDHSESTKDPVCVRKSSQSKASELKTARENLFLSTQRDSVDENRSKNAPSGQNND